MNGRILKFRNDSFLVRPRGWPLVPGREVYYDEVRDLRTVNNGQGPVLELDLSGGEVFQVRFHDEKSLAEAGAELARIVRPEAVREKRPLSFERIGRTAEELAASRGANMRKLSEFLLRQGVAHGASDIAIEPDGEGFVVRMRIDGAFFPALALSPERGRRVLNCLKVASGMAAHRRDAFQEGRISLADEEGGGDVRVSVAPSESGERMAVRLFDRLKGTGALGELGFDEASLARLETIAVASQGLFAICGPSGSGKTTTQYALLRHIQARRGQTAHIITLEDPIEYRLPGISQVQVSGGGDGFAEALKSSLRQDPGVIMVGEVRDGKTAEVAVRAALTGHLVLTTLHAGRAAEAIGRLLDLGVRPFLLQSTLRGCLCQRLVRMVCDQCGRTVEPALRQEEEPYRQGKGCPACRMTGYRGRTVLAEFLENDEAIGSLIREGADTGALLRAAGQAGMTDLYARGRELVQSGVTDPAELRRVFL